MNDNDVPDQNGITKIDFGELGLGPQLVNALAEGGGFGGLDLPKPFSNKIVLIERTAVAGTSRVANFAGKFEQLQVGDGLDLVREPGNRFDMWAIRVSHPKAGQLGYLACDVDEIPARLMDGGKHLVAKAVELEELGQWSRVLMKVCLDD